MTFALLHDLTFGKKERIQKKRSSVSWFFYPFVGIGYKRADVKDFNLGWQCKTETCVFWALFISSCFNPIQWISLKFLFISKLVCKFRLSENHSNEIPKSQEPLYLKLGWRLFSNPINDSDPPLPPPLASSHKFWLLKKG